MITKIDVVLARTEYPSNIGASARAMANMGGDRLILVDPRCKVTTRARQAAAGAQKPLKSRVVHKTWQDFYEHEPEGFRLALTRRAGRKRRVIPLEEALKAIKRSRKNKSNRLYLIFGPEADGLDSSDLTYVHECVNLPVFGEFASYNLAQAVLIAMFITRQTFPPQEMPAQTTGKEDEVVQPFYFPDASIREWLTAMGFDIQARKSSAYLTLKRLFLQKLPTRHEMQVLEAILQQNIRKLKNSRS
jgi:TrmH family RNA methyltransferase